MPQTKSSSSTSILWSNEDDRKLTSSGKSLPLMYSREEPTHTKEPCLFFSSHPMCSEDPPETLTCSIAPAQQLLFPLEPGPSSPTPPILLSNCLLLSQPGFLVGNLLAWLGLKNGKGISVPQRKSKQDPRTGDGCALCSRPCHCAHSAVGADCGPSLAERLLRHVSSSSRQPSKPSWDPASRKVLPSQPRLNQTSDFKDTFP